ncbi:MAG: T9SS C-terminal target domain-containing protein [Ignavibacteriae bacterium]|nr:MAG: T9SS C-terminal target domain-containing protein [Ignavibacteriota bacterium]
MKKTTLILLFYISLSTIYLNKLNCENLLGGYDDWNMQSNGLSFNSGYFINQNTGWFASNYGTIIKTTNGGNNWFHNTDTNLYAINITKIIFVNDVTGFACGYGYSNKGYVLRTPDSGNNWQYIEFNSNIYSIYFLNSKTGYAGADNNKLYKTTTNGITWTSTNINNIKKIYSIFFINANTGFIGGADSFDKGIALKTTNAGNNWDVMLNNSNSYFVHLQFVSENTGFIGTNTILFKTTNQGNNWILNDSGSYVRKMQFIDSLHGYQGGYSFLKRTTNAGISWQLISEIRVGNFYFFNNQTGFASLQGIGKNGIYKTTNSGFNWYSLIEGKDGSLLSMCFNSDATGWLISNNKIIKSIDGGNTWEYPSGIGGSSLKCIHFINNSTGCIVGGGDAMINAAYYSTTNGGINWSELIYDYIKFNYLTGIDNIIYCIGFREYPSFGGFIKRAVGNLSWSDVLVTASTEFYGIHFPDSKNGYAVGSNGKIFKSTNYGLTWFEQASPTQQINRSVFFVDSLKGWIVGCNSEYTSGQLLKTTNGGENWLIDAQQNLYLNCIKFVNYNTGWSVGAKGKIIYTTNSGINWINFPKRTSQDLFSIYFKSIDTGWIMGNRGLLLKTINCGGLVGIENNIENKPIKFYLNQNYPNPFNPSTKIKFEIGPPLNPLLRNEGTVTLKIYDVIGREITTLVNEQLKPGTYEIEWNASDYPSGVYFYTLKTESYNETKRMALIK